jgi:hypothetical protein
MYHFSLYSCTIFQIIHEIIIYHLFVLYFIVIGQFGHCNQDLINLLLTGRATSNVFDGEMSLGDGMGDLCVRGVDRTCDIGYLTHLEALRYCQVSIYHVSSSMLWFLLLLIIYYDINHLSIHRHLYKGDYLSIYLSTHLSYLS